MTPFIDPDLGKPADQLFGERLTRMTQALQLKQPDRIPIVWARATCWPRCTVSPGRNSTRTARRNPDAAQGRAAFPARQHHGRV